MIKQRQESVELYEKGGRAELAAQERDEIEMIAGVPAEQMSEDESRPRSPRPSRRSARPA